MLGTLPLRLCAAAALLLATACGGGDEGGAAGAGGGADTGGAVEDAADAPVVLELATHPPGKKTVEDMRFLHDGDDLTVELGFQGAYMVVLGFRAKNLDRDTILLRVALTAGGEERTSLEFQKPRSLPLFDDGDRYFHNIYLLTNDYQSYADELVTIALEVYDEEGATLGTAQVDVVIRPPL